MIDTLIFVGWYCIALIDLDLPEAGNYSGRKCSISRCIYSRCEPCVIKRYEVIDANSVVNCP